MLSDKMQLIKRSRSNQQLEKREPTINEVEGLVEFLLTSQEFFKFFPSNTLLEYLGNNFYGSTFRDVDKYSLGIKVNILYRDRIEEMKKKRKK
jgi:hypothetical protein